MTTLPGLLNFIEVELHLDKNGRTLIRNGKKPSNNPVKHLFITESPGLHPVQQRPLEELTEPVLDRLTFHAVDEEYLATSYEFTEEESDDLVRFPQNILLGSGLIIPEQTLYLRGSIALDKSKLLWVQRRSVVYYRHDSYSFDELFKKKEK